MREARERIYLYHELSPAARERVRYDFVNVRARLLVEGKLKNLLHELFGEGFNDCLEAEFSFSEGNDAGLNVYGRIPVRMLLGALERTECRTPERHHFYSLDYLYAREKDMIDACGGLDGIAATIAPLFDGEPSFFVNKNHYRSLITEKSDTGCLVALNGADEAPLQSVVSVYTSRLCRAVMKAINAELVRFVQIAFLDDHDFETDWVSGKEYRESGALYSEPVRKKAVLKVVKAA